MSIETNLLPSSVSGTSPSIIRRASLSITAVFPTPGSPIKTGLFFLLLLRICTTLSSSAALPTTGSSSPFSALLVRSVAISSRVGVEELLDLPETGPCD